MRGHVPMEVARWCLGFVGRNQRDGLATGRDLVALLRFEEPVAPGVRGGLAHACNWGGRRAPPPNSGGGFDTKALGGSGAAEGCEVAKFG